MSRLAWLPYHCLLDVALAAAAARDQTAKLFLLLRQMLVHPRDAVQVDALKSIFRLDF